MVFEIMKGLEELVPEEKFEREKGLCISITSSASVAVFA